MWFLISLWFNRFSLSFFLQCWNDDGRGLCYCYCVGCKCLSSFVHLLYYLRMAKWRWWRALKALESKQCPCLLHASWLLPPLLLPLLQCVYVRVAQTQQLGKNGRSLRGQSCNAMQCAPSTFSLNAQIPAAECFFWQACTVPPPPPPLHVFVSKQSEKQKEKFFSFSFFSFLFSLNRFHQVLHQPPTHDI